MAGSSRQTEKHQQGLCFRIPWSGRKPSPSTTIVGVGVGLQMQLTFLDSSVTENELESIKRELLKEEYVQAVLTKKELLQQGYWRGANVDLLVIPSEDIISTAGKPLWKLCRARTARYDT